MKRKRSNNKDGACGEDVMVFMVPGKRRVLKGKFIMLRLTLHIIIMGKVIITAAVNMIQRNVLYWERWQWESGKNGGDCVMRNVMMIILWMLIVMV